MGLDMFLMRKTYLAGDEEKYAITVNKDGKPSEPITGTDIGVIEEEVGYWRKVNAIHKWFVDHVQNGEDECNPYPVSVEQLTILLELVKDVLSHPLIASEVLPSQEGFFFGTYEYDEWYFDGLQLTKEIIEKILKDEEEYKKEGTNAEYHTYEYCSSW